MPATNATYLISSLLGSSFARSRTLGSVLSRIKPDAQELHNLLDGSPLESQIVWRSKYSGAVRPGSHLSPALLAKWCGTVSELEEFYWKLASQFDNVTVFNPVFLHPSDSQRVQGGLLLDPRSSQHFTHRALHMAQEHGGWVAKIDIAKFYESISPSHVFDIFGSKKLNLPPTLVDEIAFLIEEYGGVPQGYPPLHILSRLLLTWFDVLASKSDLPYIRFADDIWLFGSDEAQIQARVLEAIGLVSDLGFSINPNKSEIDSPDRIEWIIRGIFWGPVPIDDYGKVNFGDFEEEHPVDESESSLRISLRDNSMSADLDWLRLYNEEFAPWKMRRSDHGNRITLEQISARHPEVILRDAFGLAADRPYNVPYFLSNLQTRPRQEAGWSAYNATKGNQSRDDDLMVALVRLDAEFRLALVRKVLNKHTKIRSARNMFLDILSSDESCVEDAIKLLRPDSWFDEHACMACYLTSLGGTSNYIARYLVRKLNSSLGLLYEMCSSVTN